MNLWQPTRWLNRRLGMALLKGFLVGLAVAMIATGLRLSSVDDWRHWLSEHAGLFLAWRFLLYGLIAWGWLRMRRLRQYEPAPEARKRWRRTEIAVVTTFVLLEVSQLLQWV